MQHGQFIPRVAVIYTCNVKERAACASDYFKGKTIAFCTSETNFEVYNKISWNEASTKQYFLRVISTMTLYIWHIFWHYICSLADIYSDILSDILSGILLEILSDSLADILCDILHLQLRSGSAQWDLALAVAGIVRGRSNSDKI